MNYGALDWLCELCHRPPPLTFHHLIPRRCHSNKWFRKAFTREEMQQGIYVCRQCHSFIHRQFGHKELGRLYNTREKLLQSPIMQKYLSWARKQVKV